MILQEYLDSKYSKEELKNKGWDVNDIEKFKQLCFDNCERAERDSNID